MVQLGDRARDRVSGYEGIVISITRWLTGCDTAQLRGAYKIGDKELETHSFDVVQLEIIDAGVVQIGNVTPEPAPRADSGGPHDTEPSQGRG